MTTNGKEEKKDQPLPSRFHILFNKTLRTIPELITLYSLNGNLVLFKARANTWKDTQWQEPPHCPVDILRLLAKTPTATEEQVSGWVQYMLGALQYAQLLSNEELQKAQTVIKQEMERSTVSSRGIIESVKLALRSGEGGGDKTENEDQLFFRLLDSEKFHQEQTVRFLGLFQTISKKLGQSGEKRVLRLLNHEETGAVDCATISKETGLTDIRLERLTEVQLKDICDMMEMMARGLFTYEMEPSSKEQKQRAPACRKKQK